MIKAIFFDVDDTMYDHLTPFKNAIEHLVSNNDVFPFEEAYHRMRYFSDKLSVQYGGADHMAKLGIDKKMQAERFQLALADFNIHISEETAIDVQARYLATQFNISLFPHLEDEIKRLQQKGFIVGLLTNGAEQHQRKKIDALHLNDYIDHKLIYISGAFGIDKPDPAIFNHIAQTLELEGNHCLYIGDSWRNDVVGATSANWNVVWFNHRKQAIPDPSRNVVEVKSVEQLISYLHTL